MGDLQAGHVIADRYRVLRGLEQGSLDALYLTEHVRVGRKSAVQVLASPNGFSEEAVRRFEAGLAKASRINHPSVASIYDFGQTNDGGLYFAMEFVDGDTLARLLGGPDPLTFAQISDFARQIADALHAAHQLNVVHGYLTPSDILIGRDATGMEYVKVKGFGIAEQVSQSDSGRRYASPEQRSGSAADVRSDIFGLGQIVAAMLRPHEDVPAKMQAVLRRALSENPNDRYRRVSAFALEIASALGVTASTVQPRSRSFTPLGVLGITEPRLAFNDEPLGESLAKWRYAIGGFAALLMIVTAVLLLSPEDPPVIAVADTAVLMDTSASDSGTAAITTATSSERVQSTRTTKGLARQDSSPRRITRTNSVATPSVVSTARSQPDRVRATDSTSPVAMAKMMDRVGRRAGVHYWLRANGDSSDAAIPSRSDATTQAAEITGHLSRAKVLLGGPQIMRGIPELRTAYEEYLFYAADHPGTPLTAAIGKQFRDMIDKALKTCATAAGDSAVAQRAPGMSCMALAQVSAMMPLP